ncbi:PAAR domain-containing protein [Acinetobacter shaoyimingii]|uniref:PAAR domain-containing protein n=1 Tax=Acinetobacter shaoyimingii TaxID=2715164 RepID=A0A6G8RV59_9GAMM|nr:PAAR domain-containing protein [Acinetobacter shaoyimingii]NHB58972.1 PAAR domain-containing protein [Acinetobacter shaoyimingii]QIO05822.1 PAAR domain-containing protein [Acinetobacter shaoyimingii]
MSSPIFLHELPEEQFNRLSHEDIEKIREAEKLYWSHKPFTTYYIAFNGAKTMHGGLIRASNDSYKLNGISLALVGDEAIYSDGSTAKIISGAGSAITVRGLSAALIGSQLDNGDEIIDSPITSHVLRIYHDQLPPEGFMKSACSESKDV